MLVLTVGGAIAGAVIVSDRSACDDDRSSGNLDTCIGDPFAGLLLGSMFGLALGLIVAWLLRKRRPRPTVSLRKPPF